MTRTSPTPRPTATKKAKEAVDELSRPGPLPVLRGDLGMVGIPGVIFAPAEGMGLPAVAFGHDWLQPGERYAGLLRHLASWGIVAAAPSNHRGALPSHTGFAADLRTTLDVCAGVRLGDGKISVDARRTALLGHGIGGGIALLAAQGRERLRAVVTLAVSQSRPSAIDAAAGLTVPTLHIVAGRDTVAPPETNADPIAAAGAGPVYVRTLPKATHSAFLEGSHWSDLVIGGKPDAKVQRLTRALVTAFLLRQLADEERAASLVDGDVPGTTLRGPQV